MLGVLSPRLPCTPCMPLTSTIRPASLQIQATHEDTKYTQLLQKGKRWTLNPPDGQLLGRAGRRCVLEDGERALQLCMSLRPEALSPRVLMMTNLIMQNRGREREVPTMAIQTLKRTRLKQCSEQCSVEDTDSSIHVVELGLQALKKAGREHSMRHFIEDAGHALPSLSKQFQYIAYCKFHVHFDAAAKESERQFNDFLTTEESMDE